MFQRCVSLLLILGLLASQLATVPHAHGAIPAEDQREHDAAPHFHCDWLGQAEHDHNHEHHSHHHSHFGQRPADESSRSSDDSDGQLLGTVTGADHDANAVFVAKQTYIVSRTIHKDPASACQFVVLATLPNCLSDSRAIFDPFALWHPPDKVLDGSEIYLTLRNLRI
jgi:hypothetical protein